MSLPYRIVSADEVPQTADFAALIHEYFTVIHRKFRAIGGPDSYTPEGLVAMSMASLPKCLPPTGRLMLALDADGHLLGCGTLQQARADAGELKRLYVRPQAQGRGLGRALVEARIAAARQMGWRKLLVNALKGNSDMLKIYEKMGFQHIDRYPECTDPEVLAAFFIYMECDLD